MDDMFRNNDFYGPSLFDNDEYNDEEEIEELNFQLTANEKAEVVANCDHLKQLKYNIYIVFIYFFNKSE